MKLIASAFIKAKKEFSPALKDKTNPAFRSKYADLGACIEAVNDAFLANGIAMYQVTHDCDNGVIVETILLHDSGETLSGGRLHVPATKHDAQGYGSALSYARRYSLMAACGIAPEDDDGNAATKAPPSKKTISATDGAIDSLKPQDRKFAISVSAEIAGAFAEGADWAGFEAWEGIDDNEVKIAVWSLLQSGVRSKIKSMKAEAEKPVAA